jgi:chemotaxis protein MotB
MKPRQSQSENTAGQSGIRVLVVSLFIILLAFFIVLNSIGVIDERRKLEALGSLIGSFGILPGGLSPIKGKGEKLTASEPPMMGHGDSFGGDSFGELVSESEIMSGPISVATCPEGKMITIRDKVIFDEGSYKIRPSSYGFLRRLCEVINQDNYPVEVTGHTDNRPPDEKSFHSNWEISSLKAMEVLKFFVVIGKVHPKRLTAYGCGEYKPIASNKTRQTRAQNRRVDIILDHRCEARLKQVCRESSSRFFVFKRFLFRMFD